MSSTLVSRPRLPNIESRVVGELGAGAGGKGGLRRGTLGVGGLFILRFVLGHLVEVREQVVKLLRGLARSQVVLVLAVCVLDQLVVQDGAPIDVRERIR